MQQRVVLRGERDAKARPHLRLCDRHHPDAIRDLGSGECRGCCRAEPRLRHAELRRHCTEPRHRCLSHRSSRRRHGHGRGHRCGREHWHGAGGSYDRRDAVGVRVRIVAHEHGSGHVLNRLEERDGGSVTFAKGFVVKRDATNGNDLCIRAAVKMKRGGGGGREKGRVSSEVGGALAAAVLLTQSPTRMPASWLPLPSSTSLTQLSSRTPNPNWSFLRLRSSVMVAVASAPSSGSSAAA